MPQWNETKHNDKNISNYVLSFHRREMGGTVFANVLIFVLENYDFAVKLGKSGQQFALKYFDVPYTTWVKYIWRFVLMLLLLVILVLLVLSLI